MTEENDAVDAAEAPEPKPEPKGKSASRSSKKAAEPSTGSAAAGEGPEPAKKPASRKSVKSSAILESEPPSGFEAYHRGDYEDAASLLKALAEDESVEEGLRARAAYRSAEALIQLQRSQEAIAALRSLADRFPLQPLSSAGQRRADAVEKHLATLVDG
ncbi:tetratricopeptide repeat protein [Candidatus Poribacteria bacterium]|nr:tetratricopeptide repeat protein [Candidatus Poribacteria bacterium]